MSKVEVLFFIESLHPGGKERRLVELIKGLSSDESIKMHLVLTKKNVHYIDVFSTNINIHYLQRKTKKDMSIFNKFFAIAKQIRPDIIHVWGNMVAIYAIPSSIFLRIPLINNQIADAPTHFSNTVLSHKLSFPFSNLIISNSHAGLEAYKAPKNKSRVIYNGFNFDRLSSLTDFDIIKNKFNIKTKWVVGMVASFSEKKDYTTYIEAANIILQKERNVTFLCIGAGDDRDYKLKVSSENKDNILFLGKQNNVESIMNVCDIGVLSTYTEGISNALLEFCALGKPVVTNYGGGNAELVCNGETGYLVDQKSPKKLAEKIYDLISDEEKRLSFGMAAKKRVTHMFSITAMVENFKKVYFDFV